MKTRLLILTGTIAAISCAHAQTPTAYYNFDSGTLNLGSLGTNGTLQNASIMGGTSPGFSGGDVLTLTGASEANNPAASLFDTGLAASALGFHQSSYTAGAWVKLDSFGGDSMIFGQKGEPYLHNGIRDNNPHIGHWGADTTGSTNLAATIGAGNWFHLAFRINGTEQSIYVNGALVARGNQAQLNNASNIVIGSSGNGGSLPGQLDDVVVYKDVLRPNQISHLALGGDPLNLPAPAPGGGVLPTPIGTVAPSIQPAGPIAPGGSGQWGVREIRGANVNTLSEAYANLGNNLGTATDGFKSQAYLVDDVDGNTTGHQPLIGSPVPSLPLTNTVGAGEDNVTLLYRAKLKVTTAGNYTFNNHGDDGFALRIGDFSWTSRSGDVNGIIDFDDPRILSFNIGTGDTNTRGVINLPVGEHDIEYITWEGGGGFGHQLSYHAGAVVNDGDTQWRALGGPLGLVNSGDQVRNIPGVKSDLGWTVKTSTPGANGAINNIAQARAALAASGTDTFNVSAINYIDPQTNGNPTGDFGGDVPFPKDTIVDDEDYAISAFALLTITTADTYRFVTSGDDGGLLRIQGVSGWTIVSSNNGGFVANSDGTPNPNGDTIWVDALTGNHRTVADIALPVGEFLIEGLFFERGGGSWWEIGAGDADVGAMVVLASGGNQDIPAPVDMSPELQIVPEPASAMMLLGGLGTLLGMQRMRRRK